MREIEHPNEHCAETIARWYVAPLTPAAYTLRQHLAERRSIAEVLAKRRFLEEALAHNTFDRDRIGEIRPVGSRSESVTVEELRTRAARYRDLAKTLVDPTVIAVVQRCARELESESARLERAGPDRLTKRD